MTCTKCGWRTRTEKGREKNGVILRKRICTRCGHVIYTAEKISEAARIEFEEVKK